MVRVILLFQGSFSLSVIKLNVSLSPDGRNTCPPLLRLTCDSSPFLESQLWLTNWSWGTRRGKDIGEQGEEQTLGNKARNRHRGTSRGTDIGEQGEEQTLGNKARNGHWGTRRGTDIGEQLGPILRLNLFYFFLSEIVFIESMWPLLLIYDNKTTCARSFLHCLEVEIHLQHLLNLMK